MCSTCFDQNKVSSIYRPSVLALLTCLIALLFILILGTSSINAGFCLAVTSIKSVLLTVSDSLFAISQLSKFTSSLFMWHSRFVVSSALKVTYIPTVYVSSSVQDLYLFYEFFLSFGLFSTAYLITGQEPVQVTRIATLLPMLHHHWSCLS